MGKHQAGVLAALNDRHALDDIDIIVTISVGSLNGIMVAQNRISELIHIWGEMSNEALYTGKVNLSSAFKSYLFRRGGLARFDKIEKLLDRYVDLSLVRKQYQAGFFDLQTELFHYNDPIESGISKADLIQAIKASALMPIVWEPIKVHKFKGNVHDDYPSLLVDGGLRTSSPTRWIADHISFKDVNSVLIINATSRRPQYWKMKRPWLHEVALRVFGTALKQVALADQRELSRIDFVNEHLDVLSAKGYRFIPTATIEPSGHYPIQPWDFESLERFEKGRHMTLFEEGYRDGMDYLNSSKNIKNQVSPV